MEAFCSSEDMLAKASQVWTMLDDMAENSPESYRQFMQQQLNSAKQYYAPPEPCLCLEAWILEPTKKRLFVNLCSWNKVPPPQSQSDPVPLSAGKMDTFATPEPYSIVDIAYNPSVLERGENPLEKVQLVYLLLKFLEERYDVTLSPNYSMAKCKLKGSLERMRHSLRGGRPTATPSRKSTKNEVTLEQLRKTTAREEDGGLTLPAGNAVPHKQCLIEEISSTEERPEELKSPAYEVTARKDASGKALRLDVTVEVPEVRCVSECHLSISKDDLLMECPQKYRLHLNLPEPVEEEAASARFFKKKGVLLITMPVCQQKRDPSADITQGLPADGLMGMFRSLGNRPFITVAPKSIDLTADFEPPDTKVLCNTPKKFGRSQDLEGQDGDAAAPPASRKRPQERAQPQIGPGPPMNSPQPSQGKLSTPHLLWIPANTYNQPGASLLHSPGFNQEEL